MEYYSLKNINDLRDQLANSNFLNSLMDRTIRRYKFGQCFVAWLSIKNKWNTLEAVYSLRKEIILIIR